MAEEPVRYWTEGRVGLIELARPEKYNALSRRCWELIGEALDRFEPDTEIRALLIRSTGKNFCTGADLAQVNSFGDDGNAGQDNSILGHAVLKRMEASRLPVVVAVQGLALAGGLELVLGCDVVFAAETARLGDQHAHYGLIPGWGGSARLPKLVGLRRSLDLLFTAKWLDAKTAESWGLINHVVPDAALHDEALKYCAAIAARNFRSIALMKRLARAALDTTLETALDAEMAEIPAVVSSPNVREGVMAFNEKREPNFV